MNSAIRIALELLTTDVRLRNQIRTPQIYSDLADAIVALSTHDGWTPGETLAVVSRLVVSHDHTYNLQTLGRVASLAIGAGIRHAQMLNIQEITGYWPEALAASVKAKDPVAAYDAAAAKLRQAVETNDATEANYQLQALAQIIKEL